jgi:4-amino-4-deoxy-L-arabinose transferase-like glycosyltransferase
MPVASPRSSDSTGAKMQRTKSKRNKGREGRPLPEAGSATGPPSPVRRFVSREKLILAAILALGLALRVFRLMENFPIVGDEGIYLRWAEIIDHQGQWFISLLDGKQPLPFWLLALQRFVWDGDPLLAARLLSVAAGLLATIGIYAIGKRLAGESAGLTGALLYAALPWAIMYDRLAFVDAMVNLAGVAIVYTAIGCFQRGGGSGGDRVYGGDRAYGADGRWREVIVAGLAVGLGFFTKSTVLLFVFFPVLAAVWWRRARWKLLIAQLAVIYAIAAIFPVVSWLCKPDVPTFETTNMVLHQSFFFAKPAELLANPFSVAAVNFPLFFDYVSSYLTWPAFAAALAALGYLSYKREGDAWLLFSVTLLPLLVQIFVLKQMFPTRYPFPHIWPLLLLTAMGIQRLFEDLKQRWETRRAAQAAAGALMLALAPMLVQSVAIVRDPKTNLSRHDSGYFLGTYSHAGFGVREAIDFLIAESERGPFVLLTDPIWSVPADAMFPYLNFKHGIRVYEAWWTQLSGTYAIFPHGTVDLLKSHYERVKAGKLDLTKLERVYYITDTNYYTPEDVRVRQPDAQLLQRFPKPGNEYFVDVYRLK